jgi:ribosome-associated protein
MFKRSQKKVKTTFKVPLRELSFEFFRSSGPGGQNVNKVSTGVRARWNIKNSIKLSEEQKQRIKETFSTKISEQGDFIIESQKYRSQSMNKIIAAKRLQELIDLALRERKQRRKITISDKQKEKMIDGKKRISQKKELRKIKPEDLE